ncbi:MAG: rRNA maturation RNase YbeY [Chloroflexi bacterium]|nr:rRNA maturation RNase YbeY [Chloroflexota bacterium]
MPLYDIQIHVDDQYRDKVGEEWLSSIVETVLASEQVAVPAEVSLVITGQETIRGLNRDYRGLDEATDVLSFALKESRGRRRGFAVPPDGVTRLGEVIVSYPQATAQASERGSSVEQEIGLLVVHGILHLLGYDHMKAVQATVMEQKQTAIMDELFQL